MLKAENGWASIEEYKDGLYILQHDPYKKTFDDYYPTIDNVFHRIRNRFGTRMPNTRLSYILMKFFHMKKYEAQKLIRCAIDKGIISIGDNLWSIIGKE